MATNQMTEKEDKFYKQLEILQALDDIDSLIYTYGEIFADEPEKCKELYPKMAEGVNEHIAKLKDITLDIFIK